MSYTQNTQKSCSSSTVNKENDTSFYLKHWTKSTILVTVFFTVVFSHGNLMFQYHLFTGNY